jgi:hypothetical protein
MMQKLKDLKLWLTGTRNGKFAMVALALAALFLYMHPDAPKKMVRKGPEKKQKVANLAGAKENAEDIITRFRTDVEELQKRTIESQKELMEQRKQLNDYEVRTAEIMKKLLERMAETRGSAQPQPASPVDLGDGSTHTQPAVEDDKLEQFGETLPEVAPPPPPAVKKIAFVGAGDSVRVKLLAGVNAPTDGTPYPVVLKLVSDVYGPDGSTLPLGEARLIAAAQGSLTDSRALFRLTTLSIQLPNGERKVFDVDGWIVGEDGIRGMPGVLIDPIGKAIAGAGFTGAISGIGQGLSAANTTVRSDGNGGLTTMVDGDLGEYAAGKGLTGAAKEWSGIIRDRLGDMVPVVQVLSGREGTAVFARSLPVEGLMEALEEGQNGFESLD